MSAWPSAGALEALAAKYEELARLRVERAAGAPPAPRVVLRQLAARFPGSLRELDTMPLDELRARGAALREAARTGRLEPWMAWTAAYHLLLRQGGEQPAPPPAPTGVEGALLAARASPRRPGAARRTEEALRVIAEVFDVPVDEVARALLPRRRQRTSREGGGAR